MNGSKPLDFKSKMFDGYVFVDEIPVDNSSDEPCVYIYTRPFDLTSVKLRQSLSIYTTAWLKSVMICDENSKVRESIEVISDIGLPYSIELPNKETVTIKAFSYGSKTLKIIVLFEYCDRYTLYAGQFVGNSKILDHISLRKIMAQKQIDDLYIDVTSADIPDIRLRRKAVNDIEAIVRSTKRYKFHMLIDDFGYEDLLFDLTQKGIRVCLDYYRSEVFKRQQILHLFAANPDEADITITNELADNYQKLYDGMKIISIKLTTDPNAKSTDGLRIVKFSKHSTMQDIHYIAHLTAPLHIYTIGEPNSLPFNLNHLCRYDETFDKENQCNGNR